VVLLLEKKVLRKIAAPLFAARLVLLWFFFFVIEHRQAVEGNVAAPLAFQIGQLTDEFKTDLFMALAARREGLPPYQRYLVGQAMLRVNHTIYSAFGNDG
jgi:hypothetical protein